MASPVANPKRLYFGQPTTSATTLYTAPANDSTEPSSLATAIVKSIWLTNTTGTATTVTLGINGVAATNQIIPTVSVGANDVKVLDGLDLMLSGGDMLQGQQGTASAITVIISGVEIQ